MSEKVTVKVERNVLHLPAIALRGLVVFPNNLLHFEVGRDKSIAAVEWAVSNNSDVFLIAQKEMKVEDPNAADLCTYGVVAEIKQVMRVSDDLVRILVEGKYRAKLTQLDTDGSFLLSTVRSAPVKQAKPEEQPEVDVLVRNVKKSFDELLALNPHIGKDVVFTITTSTDPVFLSEYIPANLLFRFEDKQAILDEGTLLGRLKLLIEKMHRERRMLEIDKEIAQKVDEAMDKNQRDYYLHEQLHMISEELGEDDDTTAEAEEYRRKITALHLDEEREKKLLKEVDRLAKMQSSNQEGTVIRTYLDTCLDLPWNTFTEDDLDIAKVTGFLGGLLALFTPCVWPIIPMTVSFFLKRSKDKKKGIRDAWTYGASIVVIYVALGLAITLIFGASALNALSTNAIFNILFFLMLVIFAASFFGAFEIRLPSKWGNAVDSKAESTTGLLSIFLMAFTLSLVSFSCTGPIIGFLLVQVSTTGSVVAPAIGMLGFAIALALPFTLFALFPSWLKSMPKSGGWMNVIKVTLGFLELAFALKFLSVADLAYGWRLLDRETFLALWIVIFALLGFYLLGKIKFPHDDDDNKVGVTRFFMALISLAFAVYMVPGLWGAPLKAVSAFAPPMQTQDFNLHKNDVHAKFDDYDLGMEYARLNGKPVMLDFTGYGCVNCRKMEAAVWTDPKVSDLINNDYVLITLYVDNKTPLTEPVKIIENGTERTLRTVGDKWSYLQRVKFGANAQPFYVLLDNQGKPLNKSYAYNEDIPKYIEFLQTGLENYKKGK